VKKRKEKDLGCAEPYTGQGDPGPDFTLVIDHLKSKHAGRKTKDCPLCEKEQKDKQVFG